jgi:hypothetical protein
VVGLAFAITACGFAVMMVNDINTIGELDPEGEPRFIQFFWEHGFAALMIELAVLALATIGAIATDEMWSDRADSATTKGDGHGPPPQNE